MECFTTLTGVAAPLPMINVDTDMIIPKQYLKTIRRTGLGKFLFDPMRRTSDGKDIGQFILNRPPYDHASILVTGANFGCGSSREHAPWALKDFGIRCIVAPSFADIFYNNCFQNSMLPITLDNPVMETLIDAAMGADPVFTVNLKSQTIRFSSGTINFNIDADRKHRLENGFDNIALTLEKGADIIAFEENQKVTHPWLYD